METLNINFAAFWNHELQGRIVRRSGNNWLCRSPFREDKNPSFSVSIIDGVFNDFADESLRGDAIDFIKMRYGMTFPEAKAYIDGGHPSRPGRATPKPAAAAPIRQGSKADYTLREIVIGGADKRGTVRPCETPLDYIDTPGLIDCYHSVYLHSAEILDYQKRNGGKLAGYGSAVWCDVLYFDVDYKDGTLQENISKALSETRRLIQHLKSNGVSSFQIKFSGSKGFHVSISHPALSTISGYEKTPHYVERFARKISNGINVDFSIYSNATKLIRSVNSINRKSGLYAVPLSEGELFRLSVDEILMLAKKPRPQPKEFEPVRFHSHLLGEDGTIFADCCVFDNGVSFDKRELDTLRTEKDKQNIKALFLIKKSFGGTLERRDNGKT
jgi:hypothetical protein